MDVDILQDGRVEIVVEGKKRKLVIKDTHLEDAGEITCRTNKDASSCKFQVKCEYPHASSRSNVSILMQVPGQM